MKGKISMQGHREHSEIADAICEQTQAIRCILDAVKEEAGWWRSRRGLATKGDLEQLGKLLMSKWTDFAAAQEQHNQEVSENIDTITTAIEESTAAQAEVAADVTELLATVKQLQDSPAGEWTAEDQAIEDRLRAQADSLKAKTQGAADSLKALAEATKAAAALHPPTPPPS